MKRLLLKNTRVVLYKHWKFPHTTTVPRYSVLAMKLFFLSGWDFILEDTLVPFKTMIEENLGNVSAGVSILNIVYQ